MALDKNIRELLFKEITLELNSNERKELDNWLSLSENNKQLYKEVTDNSNIDTYLLNRINIDTSKSWEDLENRYNRQRRRLSINTFLRYAAVLLVFLTSGILVYYNLPEKTVEQKIAKIVPGDFKAKLELSNGELISLESTINTRIYGDSIFEINNGISSKKYRPDDRTINNKKYNRIVVPRGGEYRVILSDGTKVFLNSESEIRFPMKFKANEREVFISGEAFFDVTKNAQKPFIVKTDIMDVVVKGTSFNVKAYSDEEKVHTTLVTGSVDIYYGKYKKNKVNIKPSQQAEISRNVQGITLKEVDTYVYTSWINKCFVFREQRLEDIMRTLSRWYDVEIFYQNKEIKDMIFSGRLDRYNDIKSILEIIESTNKIHSEINNRTIILRKK